MAGSLRFFQYTADDGTEWAINADESNIEGANAGAVQDITAGVKYKVPGNLKMRVAVFINTAGTIRRVIPILTAARFGEITNTTTITDQTSNQILTLKTKIGEQVTLPKLTDTGLNDGDAD